jgi:hypothetical protein
MTLYRMSWRRIRQGVFAGSSTGKRGSSETEQPVEHPKLELCVSQVPNNAARFETHHCKVRNVYGKYAMHRSSRRRHPGKLAV